MVSSKANTVDEYIAELPPERRGVIAELRTFILNHLPAGYQEVMNWGMISYEVPLDVFPDTYNKQPLSFVALAAQKHYNSLYLNSVYASPVELDTLLKAFADADLKPNMGKSCIRFKQVSDLPLDAIGELIAASPVETFIASYLAARSV